MDSDEGIPIPRVSSPKAVLVPAVEILDLSGSLSLSRRRSPKSAAPGQLFLGEEHHVIAGNDSDLLPPVKSYTRLDHPSSPTNIVNPLYIEVKGSKVLIPDVARSSSTPNTKSSPGNLDSPGGGIRNKLMEMKKHSHKDLLSPSPKNNVKLSSGAPARPHPPKLGGLKGASFRASSKRLTEGAVQISPSLHFKFIVTQVGAWMLDFPTGLLI